MSLVSKFTSELRNMAETRNKAFLSKKMIAMMMMMMMMMIIIIINGK